MTEIDTVDTVVRFTVPAGFRLASVLMPDVDTMTAAPDFPSFG